jgi:hypothetical protein
MRSELDEALEFVEFMTGKSVDIHAHWSSINHINWRRTLLYYRRLTDSGLQFYDNIGNRKFLKRHKL